MDDGVLQHRAQGSGIYPRAAAMIQVAYEKPGIDDKIHDTGAVCGFLAPAAEVSRKPGQWESFDVTTSGRRFATIIRNGLETCG
jgi:hypothetical protein